MRKGTKHSKESTEKMSLSRIGVVPWNKDKKEIRLEVIEKLRRVKIGKPSNNTGKKCPNMVMEKNHSWRGEKVGYFGIHRWIEKQLGRPMICSSCFVEGLNRYHWANISGDYKRDFDDWLRLCPKCHGEFDRNGKKISRLFDKKGVRR